MGVETPRFSSLIDLFKSIEIVEKGIEQVYDYLLTNKKCDDLKILETKLKLNTKRIYKITSVLKDLGLIQIYNRPMNLQLLEPINAWKKLLSETEKKIQDEAKNKIQTCHIAYNLMEKTYYLQDEKDEKSPTIEFLSFMGKNKIETTFYALLSRKESCIANGIWIHRGEDKFKDIKFARKVTDLVIGSKIFDGIHNLKHKVLVSEEYIEYFDNIFPFYSSKEYYTLLKKLDINTKKFDIRVSKQPFSNFIVKDKEKLIQPSFDPSNNLIGYFISTPQEIVDVFHSKFNDLFKESNPLSKEKDELYRFLIAI
ncbi:MAG: hypothetical protein GY870_22830 [archaeon]|nr:hypothetical protein [archaeon]